MIFQDGHYTDLRGAVLPERVVLCQTLLHNSYHVDKKMRFISEAKGSQLTLVTTAQQPKLSITYRTAAQSQQLLYGLDALDVQGYKAIGSRLCKHQVTRVALL